MRRSARSYAVADLPSGARGGLRHHSAHYGEAIVPIFIGRGAPIFQVFWPEAILKATGSSRPSGVR
jgi:hypothetical protein